MIGGREGPDEHAASPEPIDYEAAVREILRRRRRRRVIDTLGKLPNPRPASPGQVVLAGLALLIIGWLVPGAHVVLLIGAAVMILGFLSGLIQPRGRRVTWRNREFEVPPDERWTDRVYYLFYRRPKTS